MHDPIEGLIYLDNAATSWPKPPEVGEAMTSFLACCAGNPGRGGHALARAAQDEVELARVNVAKLIGASEINHVILTHGCTDSVNLAVHGACQAACKCPDRPAPNVVVASTEHNAVLRSVHSYEPDHRLDLRVVTCDSTGYVDPDEFVAACDDATCLACLSHASNAVGTIQDVANIGPRLRERYPNLLFLVDAAQTLGHIPVDVDTWCVDFLAAAGHKGLRGPTGTGALYVGPRVYKCDSPNPRFLCGRQGGTGAKAPGLDMPTELPDALEAGTVNAVGLAGLNAGIASLSEEGEKREMDLAMRMLEALDEMPAIAVHGRKTRAGRTAAILFSVKDQHPRDFADTLDRDFNIATRGGTHCAPLLHDAIGTGEDGAVRASPSAFTSDDEVETFLKAVDRLASA